MRLRAVVLLAALLLSGCTSKPPVEVPAYDTAAAVLPALAVLPLPGAQAICAAQTCRKLPVPLVRDALAATTRFASVGAKMDEAEYVLAVAADTTRRAVHVSAQLYWFDQRVDEFTLEIPLRSSRGQAYEAALAASIAAHLVREFQAGKTFSTRTLHDTLQSSRYAAELRAAPLIGAFVYESLQVSHNPVHGASLRYLHRDYENAHADVFVYPIPDHDFAAPARLDEEMAVVQRDLRQLEAQGWWRDLTLEPVRTRSLPERGERLLTLRGEFRTDDDLIATSAHLFVRGDKFVKVRASYPKFTPVSEDVDEFVSSLPESLETPQESNFMARLRGGWRQAERQPN